MTNHYDNLKIIKPNLISSWTPDRTEHTISSFLMSAEELQK